MLLALRNQKMGSKKEVRVCEAKKIPPKTTRGTVLVPGGDASDQVPLEASWVQNSGGRKGGLLRGKEKSLG